MVDFAKNVTATMVLVKDGQVRYLAGVGARIVVSAVAA